jgi:hypothetical protein
MKYTTTAITAVSKTAVVTPKIVLLSSRRWFLHLVIVTHQHGTVDHEAVDVVTAPKLTRHRALPVYHHGKELLDLLWSSFTLSLKFSGLLGNRSWCRRHITKDKQNCIW